LVGPTVAAFHVALVAVPEGVWVVSLFCQRGLTVNSAASVVRRGEGIGLRVGGLVLQMRVSQPSRPNTATVLPPATALATLVPADDPSQLLARQYMGMQQQMF